MTSKCTHGHDFHVGRLPIPIPVLGDPDPDDPDRDDHEVYRLPSSCLSCRYLNIV